MPPDHEPLKLLFVQAEGLVQLKEAEVLIGHAGAEHLGRQDCERPGRLAEAVVKIHIKIHIFTVTPIRLISVQGQITPPS